MNDKGLFIGLHDADILIDHYDLEGTFLQQFTRNDPEDAVLVDFTVRQHDSKTLKFYVLSRRPDFISKVVILLGSS